MTQVELWLQLGIIAGCPGSVTDNDVRRILANIRRYCPQIMKYYALDALQTMVVNNHPHGMAARVLREIENEMDRL